jgi:hypothetical protein
MRDYVGGLVQISRACVVAKTRPHRQHNIHVSGGKLFYRWKFLNKAIEVGDNRIDLRLLQHDFGDPYTIGITIRLPGKIMAAVIIKPGK